MEINRNIKEQSRSLLRKRVVTLAISVIMVFIISCEDFTKIDPPVTSLESNTVFIDDGTATSAITGIYTRMILTSTTFVSGDQSISWLMGLASDELINYSTNDDQIEFSSNELLANNTFVEDKWREFYSYVYTANAVLEGLETSVGVTEAVKKQLEGEAKFIRALCYFYLTNLYGDVPIVTGTDYEINRTVSKAPTNEVYRVIIEDLKAAQELLREEYVSKNRIRPNKFTATALLARVYLYNEDWAAAEMEATSIIGSGLYTLESDLNNVFLIGSKEAIWQLQAIRESYNTYDGLYFILTGAPSSFNSVSLDNNLVNAFEAGDNRFAKWVGSITRNSVKYSYPYKYKIRTTTSPPVEYLTAFRLAEQYLIRAESRLQQGALTGAIEDLNSIRKRAGLSNVISINITAIEQERRVELFTEFGHRWFDLKRMRRSDAILGIIKPGWQVTDAFLPLPERELIRNPYLGLQNSGY